jgi:hypothetical protein
MIKNATFAKGIAANIGAIAKAHAEIKLIETGHWNPAKGGRAGQISDLQNKIKRAEEHITDYLMQPGTFYSQPEPLKLEGGWR